MPLCDGRPCIYVLRKIYHFFLNSNAGSHIKAQIQPEWVFNQKGEHTFLLKENEAFEKYYTLQKACDSEKEWKQCLEKMKTDLPQSFRLNTSRPQTTKHLQQILKKISNGKVLPKPWPEGEESIIWQFDKLSRWDLKNNSKTSTEIKFVAFSYAKIW